MAATSLLNRTARRTQEVTLARARELLAQAATLHLDHRTMLVRCRIGRYAGWWELDEVLRLLDLGDRWWEVRGEDGVHLAVADGPDVYRFDVS